MKQHTGHDYATFILELVRNNGITNLRNENSSVFSEEAGDLQSTSAEPSNCFLLFDYFDILYCKELLGKDKKYLNYLSIENVFEDTIPHTKNFKISYKTLSLFCKLTDEKEKFSQNPFHVFSIGNDGDTLSDTPFLGIIQISLCQDNYRKGNPEDYKNIDIDTFLTDCEKKILQIVNEKKHSDNSRLQLFRSSTTGDFCLAVRTDSVKDIYNIAITLNETQNHPDDPLKMLTYTNVGMECRYIEGKGYATLSDKFLKNWMGETIALRFSADETMRKKLQDYDGGNSQRFKGLFGRYEYLMHIDIKEFAELYPFLCEKKTGRDTKNTPQSSELVKIFKESSALRSLNERILVDLALDTAAGTDCEVAKNNARMEVLNQNRDLLNKIDGLEQYKHIFYEEHFAFQDLIRGMKEIYKTFSSTGVDAESYISWCVFQKDMRILCECINQMMQVYQIWLTTAKIPKSEDEKKQYRIFVLGDWRNNLQAINRYTTLVHNVNYQTFQSPIYEIQTQIDTEKAMVAYREAMELYIRNGLKVIASEEKVAPHEIFPIIYPALPTDTVEISAPFRIKRPVVVSIPAKKWNQIMSSREILCTVPSFEYFGRLYDLLPWIFHETSHHLRITDRYKRNKFVTQYIFSHLFDWMMYKTFRQFSDCDYYSKPVKMEQLLLSCLSEEACAEIFNLKDFKKFNFEMLMLKISQWLELYFPFGKGYYGQLYSEDEKDLKEKILNYWLDAYRKEGLLDEETLLQFFEIQKKRIAENNWNVPATRLLKEYYKNLCKITGEENADWEVTRSDMERYDKLEEKLNQWAGTEERHRDAFRDYREKIMALYRIILIDKRHIYQYTERQRVKAYLQNVFIRFQDCYKKSLHSDTMSLHIIRNLGLMHEDAKEFIEKMGAIFKEADHEKIMKQKNIYQTIYLEAYADLLMAVSLKLNSFGYCKQVLQTVSDANLTDADYNPEDINYERWRAVTAVLLKKDGANFEEDTNNTTVSVDAATLISTGKTYCFYMVQHILKKIFDRQDLTVKGLESKPSNMAERSDREEQRGLLRDFFVVIVDQAQNYLEGNNNSGDKGQLLNALLHSEQYTENKEIWEDWDNYRDVIKLCEPFKYNFWRLACFCKGISKIVNNGRIYVPLELFQHMDEVREKAALSAESCPAEQGCYWESMNPSLVNPKLDVGDFYNDPKQVYTKNPDQKLENTIDFIQNFYYYNRFRIVNENNINTKDGR